MNLLTDNLPEEIDGIPIDTDYRNMIKLDQLILDENISSSDKFLLALNLLYQEPVPDLQKAWDGLLWYYSMGNEPEKLENRPAKKSKSVFDFEQDANLIYAAFLEVYHIDLQQTPLHWWTFMALLSALPDICPMGKIMQYRSMDTSKLKGAEKKRVQEIQRAFAIKQKHRINQMTLEERNAAVLARVHQRQKEAQEWAKQKSK